MTIKAQEAIQKAKRLAEKYGNHSRTAGTEMQSA